MATIKPADQYLPSCDPDPRPGYYYCTVMDGPQYGLLAGPFDTHQEALDRLPKAKEIARGLDARSVFYGFGTARIERDDTRIRPGGILNALMGLPA